MENYLPLYSRGRPLKNLLSDFNKQYPNIPLVCNWDYGLEAPTSNLNDELEQEMYRAFVNKWYFSNIGFDTDEEFIFRFNGVWQNTLHKFKSLYATVKENGYDYDSLKIITVNQKSGADTTTDERESDSTEGHSGKDTFNKGVTTTSAQSTSNEGNKLARATPNETLSVDGTSNTTVTDSGADETVYGRNVSRNESHTYNREQSYGSKVESSVEEVREKLTPDELNSIYRNRNVLDEFALCFEKLFMGVF